MARRTTAEKPVAGTADSGKASKNADQRKDGIRETVESVVIAFILAFLFRTFEAEAFVIPTGSMAPTLMGRNKDLACANCGFTYQVNASDEVDSNTNQDRRNHNDEAIKVTACTCPVCRYTMDIAPGNPQGESYKSYKGDRILVTKFSYEFADPERYDVIVFKYPGEATVNFIKRLVGVPNETTQIYHGNIWSRKEDQAEFQIARKPPVKVKATLQTVHDNSVGDDAGLLKAGWPQRWQSDVGADWKAGEGGSLAIENAPTVREAWMHYRHIVPTFDDWKKFDQGGTPAELAPPPQLITDFTSYNTNYSTTTPKSQSNDRDDHGPNIEVLGQHWVGDLAVECKLTAVSPTGDAVLELVEGGVRFQCRFDLATGRATLSIDEQPLANAATEMLGGSTHQVRFANIDDELLLWVDDDLVEFDHSTTYNGPEADSPRVNDELPKRADLTPVGIAAKGASLKVEDLRVLRDVYYIASKSQGDLNDYGRNPLAFVHQHARTPQSVLRSSEAAQLRYLMSTPELWQPLFGSRHALKFKLGPDQFLVLGDNSPRSKDSRLWGPNDPDYPAPAYCVTRDLLIGKALFIYWPHSWDRTSRDGMWFPLFPNFARMGFVR